MNKSKILALSALLLLTGCADKGTLGNSTESAVSSNQNDDNSAEIGSISSSKNESTSSSNTDSAETIPIPTVRDTFEEEIAALKGTKFDNISFEDLNSYFFPNVSEITTYKVTKHGWRKDNDLSVEQLFENFVAYCNYLEPGKFTREELAEICEVIGDCGRNTNYNEFTKLNKDGDLYISHLVILTPDLYFDYTGHSAPSWYNGDEVKKLLGVENDQDPTRFGIIGETSRQAVFFTENVNSDKVYHLLDGDISIADAAKKVNAYMADMAGQCDDGEYQREVCAVNVADIGGGNYGFEFLMTNVVDGIKCSYGDTRGGMGMGISFTYSEGADGSGNSMSMDKLEMLRSDKPASFHTTDVWKERTPIETYNSIVPLNVAAANVSKLLSGKMGFVGRSVSLVYDIKGDDTDLLPCWRFILDSTRDTDKCYHVYVNALTGEARVKCIQTDADTQLEYS